MFAFTDYIDVRAFFIAFFIGMMITYVFAPPKKYVIQYPTPENTDKHVYRDHADVCYKYKAEEVKCPTDKSQIYSISGQQVGESNLEKRDMNILQNLSNIFDYEKK
jgi:hypothetical protein